MEYRVSWTVELDAESPEEAARLALAIQRDPQSLATHFTVEDTEGNATQVDLGALETRTPSVFVLVPMYEGVNDPIEVFGSREAAERAEQDWLRKSELTNQKARDDASDWGTSVHIEECEVQHDQSVDSDRG